MKGGDVHAQCCCVCYDCKYTFRWSVECRWTNTKHINKKHPRMVCWYWILVVVNKKWKSLMVVYHLLRYIQRCKVSGKKTAKARPANLWEQLTDWLIMKHCCASTSPPSTTINQCFHVCCWWCQRWRPDHKPVARSQQGGSSITQRALQWLDGTRGTIPCDVTPAMWNHLAGKSQMCLTVGLNRMDLAFSTRSRGKCLMP